MPNLNLLMSIATMLLVIMWFIHPGCVVGIRQLRDNKTALLLVGLFLLHVIWLFNTSDFEYALKDLRIKLPLLAFGVVIGSISISDHQAKIFFLALSFGIWIATIGGYINYIHLPEGLQDHRQIVAGISHIRLSLLMVMQVVAIIYFWKDLPIHWKIYSLIVIANTLIFFNILQAATGLIVLIVVAPMAMVFYRKQIPAQHAFTWQPITILAFVTAGVVYSFSYYNSYFRLSEPSPTESHSELGNAYYHLNNNIIENGHQTFNYLAIDEMVEAWNDRSDKQIGRKNIDTRATLIRYLTSKGLRKDRQGVMSLSSQDVRNIELGYPNEIYATHIGFPMRFHSFMFGVHVFLQTGNPTGLSFFQRVVYWKTAIHVIKENFWTGTGTGDVASNFKAVHAEINLNLDKKYWLRAHNQFLTFFATFGVLGFLYFAFLLVYPAIVGRNNFLVLTFLVIASVSFLSEDTLETQAGVTFFAFFFSLLSKPFVAGTSTELNVN